MKLTKKVYEGGTTSWRHLERIDQHCQGSTLLFRDRPFVRASGVPKIHAVNGGSRFCSASLAMCERKRDKGRMRVLCNAMFIQSIIYAGVLQCEHFTFISIDAREVSFIYSCLSS